jgi:hypothetical protein
MMKIDYTLIGVEEFLEHLRLKVEYRTENAKLIKLVYIPAGTTDFNKLAEMHIPKAEMKIYSNFAKTKNKDGSFELEDNNQGELLLEG